MAFLVDHWQSFVTSLAASLVGTGLVAILLVKMLRVPNFGLRLDHIRGKATDKGYSLPVLDISIVNKKRWLGFGSEEVAFGLFIPVAFITTKNLYLVTTKGNERWNVDSRGKDRFTINDQTYFLYRGVIHLAVHPNSRTHFLRLDGDFTKDTTVRVYYYFETQYGRFPMFLKFGERIKTAQSGRLPYVETRCG